ncbi:MAG TPA: peptide chain release factor 1 [Candidatus Hydrogenedentes bacterium]|nr:peptide chain release factor 1 [Candidatus Hydrogenedentota bacterium]HQE84260.1 peptide chain release factor 1 [Candidatus Hydrogenedentota bacterium]HQH51270.1 peptide chain release factor 1 [Candidatus Hydrogenedentota bacterium]HQM50583.1 peptide chain release factor 1 [Candidatus Hydrogenedentota bacterium]
MAEKLRDVVAEYNLLSQQMASPEIASDHDRYMKCAKAQKRIAPLVECFKKYELEENRLRQAEILLYEESDPELREMAEEEKRELADVLQKREQELKFLLIPGDPNDEKNTIMEIRAGTGGEEAALFAADLFRMYTRYAEIKGWKTEILNSHATGMGGFKEISFKISGESVYSQLKFEGGVHRVQRVPETEAQGRVHTSAVTVAVLPEAQAVDIAIDENDLQIDVYRSSGPGGQSVNTTDSAVRVTYKPTGLVVTCQDEKSQHKNKAKALMVLRSRLLAQKEEEEAAERSANRKSQVGSGDRSERIRTYNFPQNRLTDHRIKLTLHRLETIMEGDLQGIIDALIAADRAARIREE